MGMSLAITYSERDGYQTFLHHQVENLISYLKSADAVVGFNHIEFDYKVLSAYTDDDLNALNNIDMFRHNFFS
jgi:DEAD/DEAH box helicase domain-containing protein